jgi:hypothetical protein
MRAAMRVDECMIEHNLTSGGNVGKGPICLGPKNSVAAWKYRGLEKIGLREKNRSHWLTVEVRSLAVGRAETWGR